MDIFLLLTLIVTVFCGVEGAKKCPNNCDDGVYKPVCGHDPKVGYFTFCSSQELDSCNTLKNLNFRQIARGPCYPSVRDWKPQSTLPLEDFGGKLQNGKKTESTTQRSFRSRLIRAMRGLG